MSSEFASSTTIILANPDENSFKKLLPALALAIYVFINSSHKFIEITFFILGIFYCTAGIHCKRLSQGSILSFLTFTLLYRYSEKVKIVAHPLDSFFRKITPVGFHSIFPTDKYTLGLAVCALLITSCLLSLLFWVHMISIGFIAYCIYLSLEPFCVVHAQPYPEIICIASTLFLSWLIYYFQSYAIDIAVGLIICFVGICLIFAFLSKRFNLFENFEEFYTKLVFFDPAVFSYWLFYSIIGCTMLSFCIQISGYKGIN